MRDTGINNVMAAGYLRTTYEMFKLDQYAFALVMNEIRVFQTKREKENILIGYFSVYSHDIHVTRI